MDSPAYIGPKLRNNRLRLHILIVFSSWISITPLLFCWDLFGLPTLYPTLPLWLPLTFKNMLPAYRITFSRSSVLLLLRYYTFFTDCLYVTRLASLYSLTAWYILQATRIWGLWDIWIFIILHSISLNKKILKYILYKLFKQG